MFARSILRTTTRACMSKAMFSSRVTGTVKFFNSEKGFGFITPADGATDVFVHWSSVKNDGYKGLVDEEEVEFEIHSDEASGKLSAREVTGVNGALMSCQKPREPRVRREGGDNRRQGGRRDEY